MNGLKYVRPGSGFVPNFKVSLLTPLPYLHQMIFPVYHNNTWIRNAKYQWLLDGLPDVTSSLILTSMTKTRKLKITKSMSSCQPIKMHPPYWFLVHLSFTTCLHELNTTDWNMLLFSFYTVLNKYVCNKTHHCHVTLLLQIYILPYTVFHGTKKPVITMLTYNWKCTVLYCKTTWQTPENHWCWWPNT